MWASHYPLISAGPMPLTVLQFYSYTLFLFISKLRNCIFTHLNTGEIILIWKDPVSLLSSYLINNVCSHRWKQHGQFLTLAEWMNYQTVGCWLVCSRLLPLSSLKNAETHFCMVFIFTVLTTESHHCSDSQGTYLGEQGPLLLPNSTVSEWNWALQLFEQNAAIMHSMRRSVLALSFTKLIQKSQWFFIIWQHSRLADHSSQHNTTNTFNFKEGCRVESRHPHNTVYNLNQPAETINSYLRRSLVAENMSTRIHDVVVSNLFFVYSL